LLKPPPVIVVLEQVQQLIVRRVLNERPTLPASDRGLAEFGDASELGTGKPAAFAKVPDLLGRHDPEMLANRFMLDIFCFCIQKLEAALLASPQRHRDMQLNGTRAFAIDEGVLRRLGAYLSRTALWAYRSLVLFLCGRFVGINGFHFPLPACYSENSAR
jgi:hypothetical protein